MLIKENRRRDKWREGVKVEFVGLIACWLRSDSFFFFWVFSSLPAKQQKKNKCSFRSEKVFDFRHRFDIFSFLTSILFSTSINASFSMLSFLLFFFATPFLSHVVHVYSRLFTFFTPFDPIHSRVPAHVIVHRQQSAWLRSAEFWTMHIFSFIFPGTWKIQFPDQPKRKGGK